MCVHLRVRMETGRKAGGEGGVKQGRGGGGDEQHGRGLLHQAVVQVHSET